MKLRLLPALLLASLLAPLPALFGQAATPPETISASCLIALGRPAGEADLTQQAYAGKALAQLIEMHRDNLRSDAALQDAVYVQAYRDATGAHQGFKAGSAHPKGVTYAEAVKAELAKLATQPDAYREVINRAYQLVIRRDAYPEEIAYWKPYGTLPYVVLVGAIENWAFRNQPGLMVTTGTPSIAVNSRFLRTQRVPLALANEARELLGLPVWTDVARQHSPGRNIVAVGAKDIESVGGVHFLLVGGGPLSGN
ncbi:hypothetical protein ESB00_12185 [Oleiharenicola lentus]|jgi:hypothetical protein|uniref:Uncharacterized protein n=1 Tax=Oleiharenicola lentus TaxID=2508720 RepID=A0A4V1M6U2_9BACT|nr:hypothetical protein [Oleiharenicola lentus]RXK56589.1 hypothetical protein ESB00_12185 [Oleiharenicola lentus]